MGLSLTQSYNKGKKLVYPHFIYHKKNYKRIKIYCNAPCLIKHWNTELKRVERGDNNYKLKNLTIQSLRNKLEAIINRYKNNDDDLSPPRLRLELKKREKIKEAISFSTLPLLTLIQDWEKEYMNNSNVLDVTKIRTKSVVKHIKDYIVEVEKESSKTLLIDDMDDTFLLNFMNWLFIIPTINGTGLLPRSALRRFQYLQSFCIWYSSNSKEYKRVKTPTELTQAANIDKNENPISFSLKELIKLVTFTDFNFLEPVKNEKGKTDWVESDKWKKYLTSDKQNRDNKNGIVEFIYENTKYGKQTYTSWEVYKDFLVFLCSVGCRYSDGIKIKVGDLKHSKRNTNSPIEGGVDGNFVFYQKKTNTKATPRLNDVSFMIYKKYSRGKKNGDFLFPETKRGNQISAVKINKQIKRICKTIGFNRKIVKRKLGSKGIEIHSESKSLWELVTTHIGRKTYIKTMVMGKNFTTQELMKMSGHKTDDMFHQYYSITEGDILNKPNSSFLSKQGENKTTKDIPALLTNEPTIMDKLIQLKELIKRELISEEDYEEKKNEFLKSL
ncbi:hypothetical protein [Lutibacter sp.]|uniref:tyrosine-type recombinase/integrase n=1 Tax=Lutibacter sp. TaxID=1925666 RepID=UPI001A2B2432|nr:hypothetical protein [Lutibacter sp.]MBI9042074.1 hypothetical protein [Lutibacter sp.]